MGSKRTQSRQSTQAPEECDTPSQSQEIARDDKQESDVGPKSLPADTTTSESSESKNSSSKSSARGSWNPATWRTKASPLTATARESVSVAQGVTSESLEKERKSTDVPKRPGYNVSKSMRGSRKSDPLIAEATRVNATSDASDKGRPKLESEEKSKGEGRSEHDKDGMNEDPPLPPQPQNGAADDTKSIDSITKPQTGVWLGGWWSRPDGYASDSEKARSRSKRRKLDDASTTPLPTSPLREMEQNVFDSTPQPSAIAQVLSQREGSQPEMIAKTGSARSWFGLWSHAQNQQQQEDKPDPDDIPVLQQAAEAAADEQNTTEDTAKSSSEVAMQVDDTAGDERPKSSGWAFWSHDKSKGVPDTPTGLQKQLGELAVADTPSQSHPEVAQFNEQQHKSGSKTSETPNKPKRGRLDKIVDASSASSTASSVSPAPTPTETPPSELSDRSKSTQRGKAPSRPNIVLPAFAGMYPPGHSPGYLERLGRFLADSLSIPGVQASPASKHVSSKTTDLPKIKQAIAIGVHGFFPAPMLQRVLGPPTGTSIRFANHAASSISAWCQKNQPEIKDVEIEKVALEGEGLIADRVNTLWKLLLNWLTHLRRADFVMMACHSQGVPVTVMLIAKLIQLGVLSPNAKIGICAMAGINLGPFLEYRSRLFAGSALELFDFCDSTSKVSRAYFESLDVCLRHGVRISYIGSLDDQVVSLESSLFASLSHPYVHRAVFIDGRLHTSNFVTHLVIFALKLRNLGISDHGLLRELSAPLAGSLVGGEGHSRIYDDPAVYSLAIDFALESTDIDPSLYRSQNVSTNDREKAKEAAFNRRSSISGFPVSTAAANSMRRGSMSAMENLPGVGAVIAPFQPLVSGANTNPFYLPWAVRGMLEEEVVKQDMKDEVVQLVQEFEDWKPQSKVMKDVKWRLEAVKNAI